MVQITFVSLPPKAAVGCRRSGNLALKGPPCGASMARGLRRSSFRRFVGEGREPGLYWIFYPVKQLGGL